MAQNNAEAASGNNGRPKVIIIGAGFAGLTAAVTLKDAPVELTVIDRTNHHVFQPLLYQVATAALDASDISAPIRYLLRKQKNTAVVLGEVTQIDPDKRTVSVGNSGVYSYDYLLLATGTRHSYFGHDEWEKVAPGLKSLGDASEIRQRFLLAFEEAEKETDVEARKAWMTFVLIGAGPTGCELAGVMPEIAKRALRSEFRNIDTNDTRVILLEAGKRILPAFPEDLASKAERDLEKLGVEIRTGDPVVDITDKAVTLKSGDVIFTHTVVWAAGNAASPLGKMLGAPIDRAGRVVVHSDMSVPGHPEVFVAGDLAVAKQTNGKEVPGVAQGAIQEGRQAAKNILHLLYREPTQPFSYWNKGNLAVIGRGKAIADLNFVHVGGFIAWCIWTFIHIVYLIGFRSRLAVMGEWAYAYLTYQRGVRIIEETEQRRMGQTATSPGGANVGPYPL